MRIGKSVSRVAGECSGRSDKRHGFALITILHRVREPGGLSPECLLSLPLRGIRSLKEATLNRRTTRQRPPDVPTSSRGFVALVIARSQSRAAASQTTGEDKASRRNLKTIPFLRSCRRTPRTVSKNRTFVLRTSWLRVAKEPFFFFLFFFSRG